VSHGGSKIFWKEVSEKKEGKTWSALDSCNGKLQNICKQRGYILGMVTGDAGCGGRAKWREKGAKGGEDEVSILLYSESMKSMGPKYVD
jgi:hypothetical protein